MISTGVFLLAAWNLLALGGFDVETAQFVLQEKGTGTTVLASLFSVITLSAATGAMIVVLLPFFFLAVRHDFDKPSYFAASLITAMLSFFVVSRSVLLSGGALLLLFLLLATSLAALWRWMKRHSDPELEELIGRQLEKDRKNRPPNPSILAPSLILGTVVVALVTILADPWLPRERLYVESLERTVVVYVLSESSDELVYIDADSRTVERVNKAEVFSRTLCSDSDDSARPLLNFFGGYPACHPDEDS